MKTRKYTQKRRAEQQEVTRQRIVEATAALHEKVGPANATIKAIAELAGVQRLTVYRHFPDDASLFQACTSHWLAQHPPPAVSDWESISEPDARTHAAFLAFYRYYRQTEKMWAGSYRDVDTVKALKEPMSRFEGYLDQIRDDLLAAWKPDKKTEKALSITLRHCLRFTTWQSLKSENLTDKQIADLTISWLHNRY